MPKNFRDYKDLIGLLLGPIRERPALYLGAPTISHLRLFLTGYEIGFRMAVPRDSDMDRYFDNPGFEDWVYKKLSFKMTSSWTDPFLSISNGDEKKALTVFFELLEEYSQHLGTRH